MSGLDLSNGHLVDLEDVLLYEDTLGALSETGDRVSIGESGIPIRAAGPNRGAREPKPDDIESAFVPVDDGYDE